MLCAKVVRCSCYLVKGNPEVNEGEVLSRVNELGEMMKEIVHISGYVRTCH
jgi:hypothetical protein